MRDRDIAILDEILHTRGRFGHREHLELAWRYLRLYPAEQAALVVAAAVRRVARLHGAEDKYHETITRTWLHFVAVHMHRWGAADTFDEFLERNPDLLNGKLIEEFYSPGVLSGDSSRVSWSTPDLRRLPALA
jgi:hypothetical protein